MQIFLTWIWHNKMHTGVKNNRQRNICKYYTEQPVHWRWDEVVKVTDFCQRVLPLHPAPLSACVYSSSAALPLSRQQFSPAGLMTLCSLAAVSRVAVQRWGAPRLLAMNTGRQLMPQLLQELTVKLFCEYSGEAAGLQVLKCSYIQTSKTFHSWTAFARRELAYQRQVYENS